MAVYSVKNVGEFGVMSDMNPLIAPPNSWTEAQAVRYENNLMLSMPAYYEFPFGTPIVAPYHLAPMVLDNGGGEDNYCIYAGQEKIYLGHRSNVHVNLTRQTAGNDVNYTGTRNGWTSTLLSGIPVLNNGVDPPQSWDLNQANNFVALANWPANTTAKSVRSYKNYLVALGVKKSAVNYPHLVKWSHPADPGAVPVSWDQTNPAVDAGEYDIGDSWDSVVDGMVMRDSFIIYKRNSIWRMDWIGGPYIFRFTKLPFNNTGAITRNCIVEHDGMHIVVTNTDVVIHDGNTVRSLLDKRNRKEWMAKSSTTSYDVTFAVKNPIHNELWVFFAEKDALLDLGKMMTINLSNFAVSKMSSYGACHAAIGFTSAIPTPWSSSWTKDNLAVNAPRLFLASFVDTKIRLADGGDATSSYLDTNTTFFRNGIALSSPNRRKLITNIIPKLFGTAGTNITIEVRSLLHPEDTGATFVTSKTTTFLIGTTYDCPITLEGRYFSIRFTCASNPQWALESYDIIYEDMGEW